MAEGCTDRGAGKADLGYGFAVWPWASHSTSPPRVLPNPHAELGSSAFLRSPLPPVPPPPQTPGAFCSGASTRLNNKRRPSRGRMNLDFPVAKFPRAPQSARPAGRA